MKASPRSALGLAAVAAVVATFATRLGWWSGIMAEPRTTKKWLLVVLLVGFGEELTKSGVHLVGMRGRFREILSS